jgi:hypothetical protein
MAKQGKMPEELYSLWRGVAGMVCHGSGVMTDT